MLNKFSRVNKSEINNKQSYFLVIIKKKSLKTYSKPFLSIIQKRNKII